MSRISLEVEMDRTNTISQTYATPIDHQDHPLYEIDWMAIANYMDTPHVSVLFSLCLSSYASPSCIGLTIQWEYILQHLEPDVLRVVIDIMNGKHPDMLKMSYMHAYMHLSVIKCVCMHRSMVLNAV